MLIDSYSRRFIADSPARSVEARVANWRKSDRILKDDKMVSLPGVQEFREAKEMEARNFLASNPSLPELIEFVERVRMESMDFFDRLAQAETSSSLRSSRSSRIRKKKTPEDRKILDQFFDASAPCDFEGCSKLREEWMKAYEEAGGEDCTGCQMGALRRQFEERVLELVNAKSG